MMLSESQERMLMVLKPEEAAEAIFQMGSRLRRRRPHHRHLRFVVKHQGEVMADLPIKELGDEAPEYDRPWIEPRRSAHAAETDAALRQCRGAEG
jgi:phosphoribosylformylglycinamidine synthase